jgi:protein arginine kinase activator
MNCERCKNKKATLFYADEGGGRHALCASCGAARDKLGNSGFSPEPDVTEIFIPPLSLTLKTELFIPMLDHREQCDKICAGCGTTATSLAENGIMGCPSCYSTFFEMIPIKNQINSEEVKIRGRMPYTVRQKIERAEELSRLSKELRTAVSEENYESAAILRDRIKELKCTDPHKYSLSDGRCE